MLPLFCYHIENRRQCVEIQSPLKLGYSNDIQQDIQKNTQLYADALSKGVRDHPEHWMFWQEFAPGQMIHKESKPGKSIPN